MKVAHSLTALVDGVIALIAWSWQELTGALPAGVRALGPARRIALAHYDPQAGWRPAGCVERRWLGGSRTRPDLSGDGVKRAILILPEALQFRTRIRLGAQACRRGEAALELRRRQFTPIPIDEAVHASAHAGPTSFGGADIDVAVTRAETLRAALASAPADLRSVTVVGDLDDQGRPRLVFARSGATAGHRALPLVAALAALLVAGLLWEARFARAEAGIDAHRSGLLVQAREIRDLETAVGWAEAQAGTERGLPLAAIVSGLSDLPDSLPSDAVLERVQLEAGSGFLVQTASRQSGGVETRNISVDLSEVER